MRGQHRLVDGVAVQTFGGVEFERAVDAQHVGGADLRHHVGGDQHDDLVEPVLRADLLRHDFAEPSQQDAWASRARSACVDIPNLQLQRGIGAAAIVLTGSKITTFQVAPHLSDGSRHTQRSGIRGTGACALS